MKRFFAVVAFVAAISLLPGESPGAAIYLRDYPSLQRFLDELPAAANAAPDLRMDLTALFTAYPEHCVGVDATPESALFVIMADGTRIIYDDRRVKSFEEKLSQPDLQDMLEQPYHPGAVVEDPAENFDPGRFRVDALFQAVYGSTSEEVKHNCEKLSFGGRRVRFNSRNGAARALGRVIGPLEELLRAKPRLRDTVFPLGGTFNWRRIEGTDRLSPHASATAVDLNPKHGAYWRWSGNNPDIGRLRRRYPEEIVRIFEQHGFIWGGKWYHYDLMHFEYRPELLLKSRLRQAGTVQPQDEPQRREP